jgi:hypothetical protein
LVIVGGVSLLATVIPLFFFRKKRFQLKQYGFAGGAVCSRCRLPFSRSTFSPNLLVGKLERCPHCGKWGIARRATAMELEEAEKRYSLDEMNLQLENAQKDAVLKKALEDSRYE